MSDPQPVPVEKNKGGRPRLPSTVVTSRRTSAASSRAYARGTRTPLDVMLDNMLFWVDKYQGAEEKLADLLPTIPEAANDADKMSLRKRCLALLEDILSARHQSQSCAVDAAPYMHAKLAAIKVSGDPDNPLVLTLPEGMDVRQAALLYEQQLDADPVVTKKKEHASAKSSDEE